MAGAYVDTSAIGRVLLGEPDRQAVLDALAAFDQQVSSRLLGTELRRLGLRHDVVDHADQLLGAIALVPIDEALLAAADTLPPPGVATLDAIHLATALRLARAGEVESLITYDARLAEGARHHGLATLAPR